MSNNKKPAFWKRFFPLRPDPSAYFRRTSTSSQVTLPDNENGHYCPDSSWYLEHYTQPTPSPDYDTSDRNYNTTNRRQSSYSSTSLCHSDQEKVRKSRNRNKSKKRHKEKRYDSDSDTTSGSRDRSRKHKKYILKTDSDISSEPESDGHSEQNRKKGATQKVVIASVKNKRNKSKTRTKHIENKKRNKSLSELSSSSEEDIMVSLKSKVKKSILKDKQRKERHEGDLNWTLRGKPENEADELMLRITMNDFKNVIKKNVISAVKHTIDAKVQEEREIKRVRCISPDILTTDTEVNSSKTSGDLLLPGTVRQDGHPLAFHLVPAKKHCLKRFLPHYSSSSDNMINSRKNSITTVNTTPRLPPPREQTERRISLTEASLLQNQEIQQQHREKLLMQTPSLRGTIPCDKVNDPVEEYYSQYLENNAGCPVIDQMVSTGYYTSNEERNGLWDAKRRHSLGVISPENQSNNTFPLVRTNSSLNSVNSGVTIYPPYFRNRRESVMSIDGQMNNMIPMARRASIQLPTGPSAYFDGGQLVSASPLLYQNNPVRRPSLTSNQGVFFYANGVADYQGNTDTLESPAMTSVPVQDANVPKIGSDLSTVVEESVQSKEECVKNTSKSETKGIPTAEILKRRKEERRTERPIKIAKISVVVSGILVVLAALGLLSLGVYNILDANTQTYAAVSRSSPGDRSFQYYCYGMCMVGVSVTFVWVSGCLGAMKVNTYLLKAFISSLVFLIVLKLGLMVAVLVSKNQGMSVPLMAAVKDDVGTNLLSYVKRSIIEHYSDDTEIGKAWDILQVQAECCGGESPEDYLYSTWRNSTADKLTKMPDSCCVVTVKDSTDPQPTNRLLCQTMTAGFWHKTGCYPVLLEWYRQSSVMALTTILSLICLEIICTALSVYLCKRLSTLPTKS